MTHSFGDCMVCDDLIDALQSTKEILVIIVLVRSGVISPRTKVYCASSSPFNDKIDEYRSTLSLHAMAGASQSRCHA